MANEWEGWEVTHRTPSRSTGTLKDAAFVRSPVRLFLLAASAVGAISFALFTLVGGLPIVNRNAMVSGPPPAQVTSPPTTGLDRDLTIHGAGTGSARSTPDQAIAATELLERERAQTTRLADELAAAKVSIDVLTAQREEALRAVTKADEREAIGSKQIEIRQSSEKALVARLSLAEEAFKSAQSEIERLSGVAQQREAEFESTLAARGVELDRQRAAATGASQERAAIAASADQARHDLQQAQSEIARLRASLERSERETAAARQDKDMVDRQLGETSKDLRITEQTLASTQQDLDTLRGKVASTGSITTRERGQGMGDGVPNLPVMTRLRFPVANVERLPEPHVEGRRRAAGRSSDVIRPDSSTVGRSAPAKPRAAPSRNAFQGPSSRSPLADRSRTSGSRPKAVSRYALQPSFGFRLPDFLSPRDF